MVLSNEPDIIKNKFGIKLNLIFVKNKKRNIFQQFL